MIRKLAPYTKGYRVYILLGILCSAGEAVLELMLPKAMSNIVDYGIGGNGGAGDRSYILTMGLKMVLMALICLALGVGAAALAAKAGMGFGANVRDAEYRQVQRFSFSNIEHFSTASLITRLTNDVSSVQMTLMMGMRMLVRAPVMLITALVMALRISLQLSQIFLVILPLLALMFIIGMIWNRASILPLLTAFWWGKLVAFFGATFFLASDGVLCDMLFVKKAEPTQQNFVVMCTYILAQTLLAIGFAACP